MKYILATNHVSKTWGFPSQFNNKSTKAHITRPPSSTTQKTSINSSSFEFSLFFVGSTRRIRNL